MHKKGVGFKKIKTFLFFLLLIVCFSCSGCKKKAEELSVQNNVTADKQKKFNDYLFNNISSVLKSENNDNNTLFYLKKILSYKEIKGELSFYYFEKYLTDYSGVFESSGYYLPSLDDAQWVESLLLAIEEKRIADEIAFLEDAADGGLEEVEQKDEEIERIIDEKDLQKEYIGKNNQLLFMEFENERFIPQKTENGYCIIFGQDNKVTRKFYDFDYRLTSVEEWEVKSSALKNEQKAVCVKNYFYDEQMQNVVKIESLTADKKIVTEYNENKKVTGKQTFAVYEDKEYLVLQNVIKYDDDLNIIENESTEYYYIEDFSLLTDSFSKKYVYTKNPDDIPPDFEYFEDDVLKMKNKYSIEKGNYTSQVFFDDDFNVKTYYENDIKVKEVYSLGENILRVKNYD